jgi:hypothetical protein
MIFERATDIPRLLTRMPGRRYWLACALVTVIGCSARPPTPAEPAKSAKPADVSTVEDFTRLRTEYGDRPDFAQICERDHPIRKLVELTNGKQYEEVLAVSQPWIEQCPVDIHGRLVTAIALTELGRKDAADEQIRWYRGLVESILASGDGRSPQTAFTVISIGEEYAVLRALKLQPQKQTVVDGVDEITVQTEQGAATIYFNPAAHLRRLKSQTEGAPQ